MAVKRFLVFRLADADFGISVQYVQEIQGWTRASPIPCPISLDPSGHLHHVDLGGETVPVIDLRRKLGRNVRSLKPRAHIIVLTLGTGSSRYKCGVAVDGVSDVLEVADDQIRSSTLDLSDPTRLYVQGETTVGNRTLSLLNLEFLFDLIAGSQPCATPMAQSTSCH